MPWKKWITTSMEATVTVSFEDAEAVAGYHARLPGSLSFGRNLTARLTQAMAASHPQTGAPTVTFMLASEDAGWWLRTGVLKKWAQEQAKEPRFSAIEYAFTCRRRYLGILTLTRKDAPHLRLAKAHENATDVEETL